MHNIFELLNPFLSGPEGSHQPNPHRLRDLAAVAITCHALSGPALDVLWDTQMCFRRLLICMPPSVVEVRDSGYEPDEDERIQFFNHPCLRRSIYLIQDPSPLDLLQMLPYARRIKRIGPHAAKCQWPVPEHFSTPSKTINWLLSTYLMKSFLPRLTHMSCPELLKDMGDIMDISFAPLSRINLTGLDFSIAFDDEVEDFPLLSILVDDLPQFRTIILRGRA
ncbi:hypothetical protein DFH29DRAFT_133122 [Suillus ampliporus]|nr:hypothetical protein DFH29DRAFT_133122 [Suillus ampliporus]